MNMSYDDRDFAESILPFLAALTRKALQLEGHRSGAEDLLHDTIERALRSRARFRAGSNMSAWLSTIMYNMSIDRRRKERHERPLSDAMMLAIPSQDSEIPRRWEFIDGDDILGALAKLKPADRYLLGRFAFGKFSYRQLSDELGIPCATVGTQLMRARRKVRSLLESQPAVSSPPARSLSGDQER
jgi:RNA polymerase sigma-70 factor, ECF subfamily